MTTTLPDDLSPLGTRGLTAFSLVGVSGRVRQGDAGAVPALWRRLAPRIGAIATPTPGVAWGVIYNGDDAGFDYFAGLGVEGLGAPPDDMIALRVPTQTCLAFRHQGHASSAPASWRAIMRDFLPGSGWEFAHTPSLERYDAGFDPATGAGGLELLLPVRRASGAR